MVDHIFCSCWSYPGLISHHYHCHLFSFLTTIKSSTLIYFHPPLSDLDDLNTFSLFWRLTNHNQDMSQSDLKIAEERLRRCLFPPQFFFETVFWEVYYVNCKQHFICLPLYLAGRAVMLWKSTAKKWNLVFWSEPCMCWITLFSLFYVVTWKIWPINWWNGFNSDKKKLKKTGL